MTVFVAERDLACFWLRVVFVSPFWPVDNIHISSEVFGIYRLESCLCFDQGCGREASPSWVGRQFLGETVANKLKGNTGTIINRCSDNTVSSAGHSGFSCECWTYVNQIAVQINLNWPNLNYPCHLVGRHLMFPVTTTRYIPWVEFVFPTSRFGRL
jgi:hypothetical protein